MIWFGAEVSRQSLAHVSRRSEALSEVTGYERVL
jgi:hypothetical protein